jgi:hypothetical protein
MKIRQHPAATVELDEALDWYAQRNPHAAEAGHADRVADRTTIGFAQDRDHLFLGESTLLHWLPLWLRKPFTRLADGSENAGKSDPGHTPAARCCFCIVKPTK